MPLSSLLLPGQRGKYFDDESLSFLINMECQAKFDRFYQICKNAAAAVAQSVKRP